MPDQNKQRLLKLASDRIGIEALAEALKVPAPLLRAWIAGHASMPDRKFLALADFLENISDPPKM